MNASAANLTWHAGSVLPYASLWHIVRRMAALNALRWWELPFATLPSTGADGTPCKRLDLLFNESCRDGYRSGAAGLSIRRLAKALAEPHGNFAWSHLRRLPVSSRTLVHPFMRICSACLAMGYHSALLCLKPLSRCPIHHLELLNACACGRRFDGTVDRPALQIAGCCPCGRTGFFTRETCRRPTMRPQDTRPLRPVAAWLKAITRVTLPDPWDSDWCAAQDGVQMASLAAWCGALGFAYPACFDPPGPDSGPCLRRSDTPLAGRAPTRTGRPVLTTTPSALPQRINAETTGVYRALSRHLRRHVARRCESFGIDFLLHPNPLQIAAVLRENRSALAAFAELLLCRAIEPNVLERRWPSRRPDDHVGGIRIRLVQPMAEAMCAVSPEVQAVLAQQVASTVVTHAWRWAHGVAINAVRTGIADWRGACEPLYGSTGSATALSANLPHAPSWATSIEGGTLRFVSAAPAASLDWSMPTPDKAARAQRWQRDETARRAARNAACTGPCLQWSLDQGWQVVDAARPAAGAVKRHRLLGAGKPEAKFWLFASGDHFVARACSAKVQTIGQTPGQAITRLRLALMQFRGRYSAPALAAATSSPTDVVPCGTARHDSLDAKVAACLAEFGFWTGAARLHDIACDHLREGRRLDDRQRAAGHC
jgi:hypothetical protein